MSQGEAEGPSVEGLDNPRVIAEIEAEFAELTAEIEKINALPRSLAPKKAELIENLRGQWLAKRAGGGDRPEWRKRMDDAIGAAITKVLEDGIEETPDGRMEFALKDDSLQVHGGPLMEALLTGFKHMLAEKLAKPPAPGEAKTPPNPLQGLMLGLGQMLVQALDNTKKTVDAKKKAAAAATVTREETEAGTVEVKLTPGGEATAETEVANINASVGFDTQKGDAVPPILPEMFQSVVANLGTLLNQASRKAPAKASAAPPAAEKRSAVPEPAQAEIPEPSPAPEPARAEISETSPAPEPPATEIPEPSPAPEPARAEVSEPSPAPEPPAAEIPEPEPAPEPPAAGLPEPAETMEPAPAPAPAPEARVGEDAATPKPEASLEPEGPAPTLKIDFAGLLGQLFKLAPHGLATRRPSAPEAPAKAAPPTDSPGDDEPDEAGG